MTRSLAVLGFAACGCAGPQSTLEPAGREAQQIAALFWWMAGGAIIIWLIMVGLALYAIWLRPDGHNVKRTRILIIGGGVFFPTTVLTVLLICGLQMLPQLVADAPEGSMQVHITGSQWWWRVRYPELRGEAFELANEIRLPVNETVQFVLNAEDVIHSFWVPALGGKVDMFPGRQTRLALTPLRTGTFRGVCAEYCGGAHAQMNFDVIVMERADFDEWLEEQRRTASSDEGLNGAMLFVSRGCGACHTIRGTQARGVVGPDLTHVGRRASLAAGVLSNNTQGFRRWLAHTQDVKPQTLMPSFGMLSDQELDALAEYLEGL